MSVRQCPSLLVSVAGVTWLLPLSAQPWWSGSLTEDQMPPSTGRADTGNQAHCSTLGIVTRDLSEAEPEAFVLMESTAPSDDVEAVRKVLRETGLDLPVQASLERRGLGDLPWYLHSLRLLGRVGQRAARRVRIPDVHTDRAGRYDRLGCQGNILGAGAISAFDVSRDRDAYCGHDLADPLDHLSTGQALAVAAAKRPSDAAGGRDRLRAGQRDHCGASSVPCVRENKYASSVQCPQLLGFSPLGFPATLSSLGIGLRGPCPEIAGHGPVMPQMPTTSSWSISTKSVIRPANLAAISSL